MSTESLHDTPASTEPPSGAERRRALRVRFARRRAERGTALFIVVLVIMSLTGIAMFAARSASSDVELAGRFRQEEQTRYVADLGLQTAIGQVSADPQTYLGAMTNSTILASQTAPCANQVTGPYNSATHQFAATGIETGGCYAFNQDTVTAAVNNQSGGTAPTLAGAGTLASGLKTDFKVELTDKDAWDFPVSGYAANNGVNMKFYTVTLSATGLVVPTVQSTATNYKVSRQDLRAQLTVGPLPDGI